MTKQEREEREYKSLFTDERYAKKAYKKLMSESLESEAAVLPDFEDSRGNSSPQSIIYNTAYKNVETRIKAKGQSRRPTKVEVMIETGVIKAAFDTQSLNLILDRTAGKVKEELSVTSGEFDELSDEELQMLAQHRKAKRLTGGDNDTYE